MTTRQPNPDSSAPVEKDSFEAESHLGKALALIHRILPRLDEPERAKEVQAALRQAANCLESARLAHERQYTSRNRLGVSIQRVDTEVAPEIAAVIAAAVAVLFDRPYRLVSVQQVVTPVPHLNVWALEGRTQIFQSHRIR
jgi:hypothetical protein